ncbi:hypothetical protein [Streptomyces sp. NRRL WC-3549]|uniref:hypothetical protein n=1 Tax=Streptomyces sp. NRRL WC-3549 TaxID=1463925 RepID=UPI00131AAE17|nr:hypothetical protein [Streptomyces sp. NRRL WC-3549]
MPPCDDTCDSEHRLRVPEPPPAPSPGLMRRAERGWARFLHRGEGPVKTGDAS